MVCQYMVYGKVINQRTIHTQEMVPSLTSLTCATLNTSAGEQALLAIRLNNRPEAKSLLVMPNMGQTRARVNRNKWSRCKQTLSCLGVEGKRSLCSDVNVENYKRKVEKA